MRVLAFAVALAMLAGCKRKEAAPVAPVRVAAAAPAVDAGAVEQKPPLEELMRSVAASAEGKVAEGFDSRDDIIDFLDGVFGSDYAGDDFKVRLARGVDAALAARAREEATWPPLTDCDRLDRAFAALEAKKIIARQDFADCQTCGAADIAELVTEQKARGYVFFHDQDTEGVVDSGRLFLAYGAAKSKAMKQVANEVVAALRAQGLHVEWNGSFDRRIEVVMDWKKRRFTRAQ